MATLSSGRWEGSSQSRWKAGRSSQRYQAASAGCSATGSV